MLNYVKNVEHFEIINTQDITKLTFQQFFS